MNFVANSIRNGQVPDFGRVSTEYRGRSMDLVVRHSECRVYSHRVAPRSRLQWFMGFSGRRQHFMDCKHFLMLGVMDNGFPATRPVLVT